LKVGTTGSLAILDFRNSEESGGGESKVAENLESDYLRWKFPVPIIIKSKTQMTPAIALSCHVAQDVTRIPSFGVYRSLIPLILFVFQFPDAWQLSQQPRTNQGAPTFVSKSVRGALR
jgi:hypothetical protein